MSPVVGVAAVAFLAQLRPFAEHVVDGYFTAFRCLTYASDDFSSSSSSDEDFPRWMSARRPVLVVDLNLPSRRSLLVAAFEQGCGGFVVRVARDRRASVVRDLVAAYAKATTERYNNKRYLFLPDGAGDNASEFMSADDMFYTPDLIFAAATTTTSGDRVDVVAHNYFHGHKWDVTGERTEVIDTWRRERGFDRGVDLFPNKMKDLHGKTVTLSTMNYSPYALVMPRDDGVLDFDGIETRIAVEFVKSCNGTWTGIDNPISLWGDLYPNGSSDGIFGSVYQNRADMGFAAFYQYYCDALECTYPYIMAEVRCLTPKPDAISSWLSIVLPFEPATWSAFVVAYVVASVFAFVASLASRRRTGSLASVAVASFFDVFRVQIQQTPSSARESTAVAAFLKTLSLYCFLLVLCWQGGIASFLTVPRYEAAIDTAEDLVARYPNIEWGGVHIIWVKSLDSTTDPLALDIVRKYRVLDEDTLRDRIRKKTFAHFMEKLPKGHFGFNDYIDRDAMKYLRLMEDNIYIAYCVIVLRKGSPYLESFDRLIHRMIDTGIILKMEVQVCLDWIDDKLQNMIRTSAQKPPQEAVVLQVSHILGAVLIYISGVVASGAVLVAEVSSARKRKSKSEP